MTRRSSKISFASLLIVVLAVLLVVFLATGIIQSTQKSPWHQAANAPIEQQKKQLYTLKKGSIGLLYVVSDTASSLKVKLQFLIDSLTPPFDFREKPRLSTQPFTISETSYSIQVDGDVFIFDKSGIVGNIPNLSSRMKMPIWCINDGGYQYRPMIEIDIPKTDLSSSLRWVEYYDNIAAFAGTGSNSDFSIFSNQFQEVKKGESAHDPSYSHHLVMEGQLSQSGFPVARLIETTSRYNTGEFIDGEPTSDLSLQTQGDRGKKYAPYRCLEP